MSDRRKPPPPPAAPRDRQVSTDAPTVPPARDLEVARAYEEARKTLTNEVELEAARLQSMTIMSSAPPRSLTPSDRGSLLSLANMQAPSVPPPQPETASSAPPPLADALPEPAPRDPLVEMRDLYSLGDYTGALEVAEALLRKDAQNAEAATCAESCRAVLVKMYSARIGPLDRVPIVAVPRHELRWLSIDHRAGFVLSHIDGTSSLEMILDVSGMPPLDALKILYELVQQRIISFR